MLKTLRLRNALMQMRIEKKTTERLCDELLVALRSCVKLVLTMTGQGIPREFLSTLPESGAENEQGPERRELKEG